MAAQEGDPAWSPRSGQDDFHSVVGESREEMEQRQRRETQDGGLSPGGADRAAQNAQESQSRPSSASPHSDSSTATVRLAMPTTINTPSRQQLAEAAARRMMEASRSAERPGASPASDSSNSATRVGSPGDLDGAGQPAGRGTRPDTPPLPMNQVDLTLRPGDPGYYSDYITGIGSPQSTADRLRHLAEAEAAARELGLTGGGASHEPSGDGSGAPPSAPAPASTGADMGNVTVQRGSSSAQGNPGGTRGTTQEDQVADQDVQDQVVDGAQDQVNGDVDVQDQIEAVQHRIDMQREVEFSCRVLTPHCSTITILEEWLDNRNYQYPADGTELFAVIRYLNQKLERFDTRLTAAADLGCSTYVVELDEAASYGLLAAICRSWTSIGQGAVTVLCRGALHGEIEHLVQAKLRGARGCWSIPMGEAEHRQNGVVGVEFHRHPSLELTEETLGELNDTELHSLLLDTMDEAQMRRQMGVGLSSGVIQALFDMAGVPVPPPPPVLQEQNTVTDLYGVPPFERRHVLNTGPAGYISEIRVVQPRSASAHSVDFLRAQRQLDRPRARVGRSMDGAPQTRSAPGSPTRRSRAFGGAPTPHRAPPQVMPPPPGAPLRPPPISRTQSRQPTREPSRAPSVAPSQAPGYQPTPEELGYTRRNHRNPGTDMGGLGQSFQDGHGQGQGGAWGDSQYPGGHTGGNPNQGQGYQAGYGQPGGNQGAYQYPTGHPAQQGVPVPGYNMLHHPQSGVQGAPKEDPLAAPPIQLPEKTPSVAVTHVTQAQDIASRRVAAPKVTPFHPGKPEISFKQWRAQINNLVSTTQEAQLKETIMSSLKGDALTVVQVLGNVSCAEMLKKLDFMFRPVGNYIDMLTQVATMSQGSKENVQQWYVRLETTLDDMRDKFPDEMTAEQMKVHMKDGFRRGLNPELRLLLRHRMKDPLVTIEQLYNECREVEMEMNVLAKTRPKEREDIKKQAAAYGKSPALVAGVNAAEEETPPPTPSSTTANPSTKSATTKSLHSQVNSLAQKVDLCLQRMEGAAEATTQSQQAAPQSNNASGNNRVATVAPQNQQSRQNQSGGQNNQGNNNNQNSNSHSNNQNQDGQSSRGGRGQRSRGRGGRGGGNSVPAWVHSMLQEAAPPEEIIAQAYSQSIGDYGGGGGGYGRGGGAANRGYWQNSRGRGGNNQYGGFGGNRQGPQYRCNNCGQLGHIAWYCSQNNQQLNGNGGQQGNASVPPGQPQ